ncbi:MAG: hypothetical protein EBS53_11685 [Bacteroidetes bacterium]|nr:hypothetical protein [Bacteroidota bacterium]
MAIHDFVKRKKAEVIEEDDSKVPDSVPSIEPKAEIPVLLNARSTKPKTVTRRDIRDLLDADLDRTIGGVKRMDALIARLVTEAIRGNMRAMELALAYLYGKPQQQTTAPNTGPFVLELTEPIVDETNGEAESGV